MRGLDAPAGTQASKQERARQADLASMTELSLGSAIAQGCREGVGMKPPRRPHRSGPQAISLSTTAPSLNRESSWYRRTAWPERAGLSRMPHMFLRLTSHSLAIKQSRHFLGLFIHHSLNK